MMTLLVIAQACFDLFIVIAVWFTILWVRAIGKHLDTHDERLAFLNSARSRVIVIGKNGDN